MSESLNKIFRQSIDHRAKSRKRQKAGENVKHTPKEKCLSWTMPLGPRRQLTPLMWCEQAVQSVKKNPATASRKTNLKGKLETILIAHQNHKTCQDKSIKQSINKCLCLPNFSFTYGNCQTLSEVGENQNKRLIATATDALCSLFMHISYIGRCHKIAAIQLIFIRFHFHFPSSTAAAHATKVNEPNFPLSSEYRVRG